MPELVNFALFLSALFLLSMLGLRHSKSKKPLRNLESRTLPGFPGPIGLVRRLDGIDRHGRTLTPGRTPEVRDEGELTLPTQWEHEVTVGRYACVAYTWALSRLAEDDPEGEKERRRTLARARIIPVLTFVIALALVLSHHMTSLEGVALTIVAWAFFVFVGLPAQGRDRKAVDLARTGLKQAGLWPQLAQDASAVDACLNAMAWSQMPGLKRVLPR